MSKTEDQKDQVIKELIDIKRLLVLVLLREGASQREIATALGVSQSSVSRMFPAGISQALSSEKSASR